MNRSNMEKVILEELDYILDVQYEDIKLFDDEIKQEIKENIIYKCYQLIDNLIVDKIELILEEEKER